jgi:predicted lipoprotein with Yx(FWY)xxD motif
MTAHSSKPRLSHKQRRKKKMKTIYRVLSTFVILALALVACTAETTPAPTEIVEPTDMATDFPTATEAATATEVPTATEAATAVIPVTGDGMLNVMEDTSGALFVVNESGKAVYINNNDTSDTSSCYDACAQEWPPVLSVNGDTSAVGAGVDAAKVGTLTRTDGSVQLTYNGWPLYTYASDTQSGDMLGQGMDGSWFLLSPTGQPVESTTMPGATATP